MTGDNDAVQLEPQPAPTREQATESPKSASTSQPKAIAAPTLAPEKESNTTAPTSSLGGSARELLNANGTQR